MVVEWLEEQVIKFHNWKLNPVFNEHCFDEIELHKSIQQAKEMELAKLKEAYSMGRLGKSIKEFNETFKQQK